MWSLPLNIELSKSTMKKILLSFISIQLVIYVCLGWFFSSLIIIPWRSQPDVTALKKYGIAEAIEVITDDNISLKGSYFKTPMTASFAESSPPMDGEEIEWEAQNTFLISGKKVAILCSMITEAMVKAVDHLVLGVSENAKTINCFLRH